MRLGILCFVAGAWWLQQQAALPELAWPGAVAIAGVAMAGIRPRGRALGAARRLIVLAGCCALGIAWAAWCAQQRLADALPPEWEGRDIAVVGVVAELPQV